MNKLIRKIASIFIPKNTPYCHHKFRNKKGCMVAKPCPFFCYRYNKEWDYEAHYCKLLKDFLDVQDQVKDCGINEWSDK